MVDYVFEKTSKFFMCCVQVVDFHNSLKIKLIFEFERQTLVAQLLIWIKVSLTVSIFPQYKNLKLTFGWKWTFCCIRIAASIMIYWFYEFEKIIWTWIKLPFLILNLSLVSFLYDFNVVQWWATKESSIILNLKECLNSFLQKLL
jgi:hypothetical protein